MGDSVNWWGRSKATGFFFCPRCLSTTVDWQWLEKVVPRAGYQCASCGVISQDQMTPYQVSYLKSSLVVSLANAPPGSTIYVHPRDAESFIPIIKGMECALCCEIECDETLELGEVRVSGDEHAT